MKFQLPELPAFVIVLLISAGSAIVTVVIIFSFVERFTPLESALSQVIILVLGLASTYFTTLRSTRSLSQETITSRGDSAVRRIAAIYASLANLNRIISQNGDTSIHRFGTIGLVHTVLEREMRELSDAIQDWLGILPEGWAKIQGTIGDEPKQGGIFK